MQSKWFTYTLIVIAIFTLTTSIFCQHYPAPSSEWTNSLKPAGKPAKEVLLASDGQAHYQILIPAQPNFKDEKAASELAQWLKEISGAEFQIVQETKNSPTRFISIGKTQALQAAKLPESKEQLADEGILIGRRGENIYLDGGPHRGPIFAVMTLLEEDLGCRWYFPGATMIPRQKNLAVSIVPRTDKTPWTMERHIVYRAVLKDADWQLHNRMSPSWGAGIPQEYGGYLRYTGPHFFVHTFQWLIPPDEFFESHPEYFALIDDKRDKRQLCETHPQVQALLIERTRKAIQKDPAPTIFSLSRNDEPVFCHCENCTAFNKEHAAAATYGNDGATTVRIVNNVAAALQKEFPNMLFEHLAYVHTVMPPVNMQIADNVIVRLCNSLDAFPHPLTSFVTADWWTAREHRKAIQGWSKLVTPDRFHIWEYTTNFRHRLAPVPNMHVMAPQLRYYLAHGATGMFMQTNTEGGGPANEREAMRSWVYSKLLWNPTRDTKTLIRDFNYGYYGNAAEEMQAYDDLLDAIGTSYGMREWKDGVEFPMDLDVPWLTKDFITQSLALFNTAQNKVKDDPELLRRVDYSKLSILYVIMHREKDYTKEQYLQAYEELENIVTQYRIVHGELNKYLPQWRERIKLLTAEEGNTHENES